MNTDQLHPQLQNQFDIMNIINVLSFVVSILQLVEENNLDVRGDVKSENSKQTMLLLSEIQKLFEKQNQKLDEIMIELKSHKLNS